MQSLPKKKLLYPFHEKKDNNEDIINEDIINEDIINEDNNEDNENNEDRLLSN
jgi:hypothetical protein